MPVKNMDLDNIGFPVLTPEELQTLGEIRPDIAQKLTSMLARQATTETVNSACHMCEGRFSFSLEAEEKERTEHEGLAAVYRVRARCTKCGWKGMFHGLCTHTSHVPDSVSTCLLTDDLDLSVADVSSAQGESVSVQEAANA